MSEDGRARSPMIAVVGPCASGKSTLVKRLVAEGHNAYAVAQEHSAVKDLWRRKGPDLLIALDVPLEVVRERRSPNWLESIYERQHQRLAHAYEAADLIINTGEHGEEAVQQQAIELIESLMDDH